MKSIIKGLCPPVVWNGLRELKRGTSSAEVDPWSDEGLFGGDGAMFQELVAKATSYGEYGVGASTIWVSRNSDIPIHAVDTSKDWIETVKGEVGAQRVDIHWANLGEVGGWGRPKSYAQRAKFHEYWSGPWRGEKHPDLVLIDGRFRVCCFFTCLLSANPGTKIVFDDYADRPHYHLIEEILSPEKRFGRQALFVVPEKLDTQLVTDLKAKFEFVMA